MHQWRTLLSWGLLRLRWALLGLFWIRVESRASFPLQVWASVPPLHHGVNVVPTRHSSKPLRHPRPSSMPGIIHLSFDSQNGHKTSSAHETIRTSVTSSESVLVLSQCNYLLPYKTIFTYCLITPQTEDKILSLENYIHQPVSNTQTMQLVVHVTVHTLIILLELLQSLSLLKTTKSVKVTKDSHVHHLLYTWHQQMIKVLTGGKANHTCDSNKNLHHHFGIRIAAKESNTNQISSVSWNYQENSPYINRGHKSKSNSPESTASKNVLKRYIQ